jgi:cardiolipin synthase (CMP-forming)
VPEWLTAAAVARDFAISGGALIFKLWFGPLHGRPTMLSKVNTALQLFYLSCVMAQSAFGLPPREMVDAVAILTLCTTVLSGIEYVVSFTRRAWVEPLRG